MVSPPDDSPDRPMFRMALYTPRATDTPKKVERDLAALFWHLQRLIDAGPIPKGEPPPVPASVSSLGVDLLIVDEVRRLSPVGLEVLQDLFDRNSLGLVFLAHPGWEKTSASQHLFASRLGMLHAFRALDLHDGHRFFEAQVQRLGLRVEEDAEEVFLQKTRGNVAAMRLILQHLLFLAQRREAFLVTGAVIEEVAYRIWPHRNGGFQ